MQTACQWRHRIIGGRGAAKMGRIGAAAEARAC